MAAGTVVGAFALIWASSAWACTSLASLNLSSSSGVPGSSVNLNGSSFSPNPGPIQAVVVHWNGINGPVLATITPNAVGSISGTVTIPQAAPGQYVIVATQSDGMGGQAFGTPARAEYAIGVPAAATAPPVAAPASGGLATTTSASGSLIALTIAFGILGVALFGAGVGVYMRQTRRAAVPSAEKVR
ncbi:MAG: hypothetical protein ACRDZ8_05705 [Acidimicrobiales bacterium]